MLNACFNIPYLEAMSIRRRIWNQAAKLALGAACSLVALGWVQAEPVLTPSGAAPGPAPASEWSHVINAVPTGREPVRETPSDASFESRPRPAQSSVRLMQDLYRGSEERGTSAWQRQGNDEASQEISSAIKEALRPAYDELVDLGVVQAVRTIKSELGLDSDPVLESARRLEEARQGELRHESVSNPWDNPADTPRFGQGARSARQIEDDQIMASIMLAALIDELKPFAYTALGLAALYYLVKFAMAFKRHKNRRHHRHQGRQHRGAHQGGGSATSRSGIPDNPNQARRRRKRSTQEVRTMPLATRSGQSQLDSNQGSAPR